MLPTILAGQTLSSGGCGQKREGKKVDGSGGPAMDTLGDHFGGKHLTVYGEGL